MGWGNCGTDARGRPIGYVFEATCDHPGCDAKIHRGLAYACGGMHGEDEFSCEGYFCGEHLIYGIEDDGCRGPVCAECVAIWEAEHPEDDDEDETPSPAIDGATDRRR